jgi:hypothetical protein
MKIYIPLDGGSEAEAVDRPAIQGGWFLFSDGPNGKMFRHAYQHPCWRCVRAISERAKCNIGPRFKSEGCKKVPLRMACSVHDKAAETHSTLFPWPLIFWSSPNAVYSWTVAVSVWLLTRDGADSRRGALDSLF